MLIGHVDLILIDLTIIIHIGIKTVVDKLYTWALSCSAGGSLHHLVDHVAIPAVVAVPTAGTSWARRCFLVSAPDESQQPLKLAVDA